MSLQSWERGWEAGLQSNYFVRRWLLSALGLVIVLLLVSAFTCYSELEYLLIGRRTDATFVKFYSETRRDRSGTTHVTYYVSYTFDDESMARVLMEDRLGKIVPSPTRREESDTVDEDWTPPAGGLIDVQYIPGAARWSRLTGHNRLWLCIPFVVSLAAMTFLSVQFYRGYQDHQRRLRG